MGAVAMRTIRVYDNWEIFLARVRTSLTHLMAEATVVYLSMLDGRRFHPKTFNTTWSAYRVDVVAMSGCIRTTWLEHFEPAFVRAGASAQELHAEHQRGLRLAQQFLTEFDDTEIELSLDVAAALHE